VSISVDNVFLPRSADSGAELLDLMPTVRTVVRKDRGVGRRLPAPVRIVSRRLAGYLSLVVLVLVWQLVCSEHLIGPLKLTAPTAVWHAFTGLVSSGELASATWSSLGRVLSGLAIGGGFGVALGLASGLSRFGEVVLDAPVQAIRMLPVLVMMYFFILWLGAGESARLAVIGLATFFPMYINTFAGVRSVDQKLVEAGRVFGLRRFSMLRRVILPGALPMMLTGLRQSMGVAWFALIFAETFNTGSGLGALIINAEQVTLNISVMIVGLLVYAVIGLVADLIVRLLERQLLSWRTTFQGA
jgi:sulfonate transport system permease protein